jgi:UrcA family protein
MKATTIALASALVTAGIIKAAPAFAEGQPTEIATSVVHTGDLDLSSKAGQRQLDRRLSLAAREVCGTASDLDLEGKNAVRECRVSVLSAARAKGDALIAEGRTGRTITVASAR